MSIASHELKTPLTSLKLQNQLRARHLRQGNTAAFTQAKIEKMVETDGRIVEGVLRLIDDMLDISRIRGGKLSFKPEEFDLSEHVREIVDRFDEQLTLVNKGYTLDAPAPVIGMWDRYRLDQVVTNLITNAIRYGANRPIAITVRADNGKAWFSVKDHGIGIAEENQQRIFQLFERAVEFNEMGGLGLGLFIVGQIVEAQAAASACKASWAKAPPLPLNCHCAPVIPASVKPGARCRSQRAFFIKIIKKTTEPQPCRRQPCTIRSNDHLICAPWLVRWRS